MPANPVATRGAVDRISAAIEAVPQVDSPDEVQRRAVAATIAAAVAGQPIPVAEGIEAARVAERQRADQLATLHAGRETAALEVVHQISAAPSEIIERHLRPAFDEVMSELGPAAAAYAPHAGTPDAALLTAPERVRQAVVTLDRLAERYAAIRAAQAVLREFGARAPADEFNDWAELPNGPELFGVNWTRRRQTGFTPWPTDPRARLVWLASEQVQVWLPTPAGRTRPLRSGRRQHRRATAASGCRASTDSPSRGATMPAVAGRAAEGRSLRAPPAPPLCDP